LLAAPHEGIVTHMTQRQLQTGIAVGASLAVLAIFFIGMNPFQLFGGANQANSLTGPGQLIAQDEFAGTGDVANIGDTVAVNYTGRLTNGTVFDTSIGRGPYVFTLGAGDVIPGWELGIAGMRVGGTRLLVIPPDLAYGANPYGPIPGNSTLIFEVELVSVTSAQTPVTIPEDTLTE
jgi:hypothetical protein